MAPSSVFSYLRRDRRPEGSSAPTSPHFISRQSHGSAPHLPGIPHSPGFADSIAESPGFPESETESPSYPRYLAVPSEQPPGRDSRGQESHRLNDASWNNSASTLRVPSSTTVDRPRPHSSSDQGSQLTTFPSHESSHSTKVTTLVRPEQNETGMSSSKPTSPWRLAFGKGLLNPQNIPPESQKGASYGSADNNAFPKEFNEPRRTYEPVAEPTIQRSGRTRLNLLNPMALLARRRSSQIPGQQTEGDNIGSLTIPALPDDYDPRIRGKIVHDFSAPRPRRNVPKPSIQIPESANNRQPSNQNHEGVQRPNNVEPNNTNLEKTDKSAHAPTFKEHFGDEGNALQVESKGYLESFATSQRRADGEPTDVPAFARKLPPKVPTAWGDDNQPPNKGLSQHKSINRVPVPPKQAQGDQSFSNEVSVLPPGVPRHMKSDASRFSFDMGGVGSSNQERIMEEKHKEKEAARKAQAQLDNIDDSDFDDFDYDGMDDDPGFEERIPGVNADADFDEDDFSNFSNLRRMNMGGGGYAPALPTVMASPDSPSPLDLNSTPNAAHLGGKSQVSGFAQNSTSPLAGRISPDQDKSSTTVHQNELNAPAQPPPNPTRVTPENKAEGSWLIDDDDDDDMYFDDGNFGAPPSGLEEEDQFDENIFDDETSHLYDRKTHGQGAASSYPAPGQEEDDTVPKGFPGISHHSLRVTTSMAGYGTGSIERVPGGVDGQRSSLEKGDGIQGPDGLTERNLEAYHSALALAATEAAAKGRFQRNTSTSESSVDRQSVSQAAESQPGLVSDDSRLSQVLDTIGVEDVFDDFAYDDYGLEDDPIIAEANAEALENDDEGFYGQEFGFYAQANGNCDGEFANGGYFGSRGVEGITRSHSGRANFQEPSLTPITERSEWSTRNSIISLTAAHGNAGQHSNPSLPNPGLAQLVDMGNLEDEMSLDALMRLRRGWGGSSASLGNSPVGHASPPSHAPMPMSNLGGFPNIHETYPNTHHQTGSSHSLPDGGANQIINATSPVNMQDIMNNENSLPLHQLDDDRFPESPQAIVNDIDAKQDAGNSPEGDAMDYYPAALTKQSSSSSKMHNHSRNSSTAESISYVKEKDEDGSSRWVLEKKRTTDKGELQVEREVLARNLI
ncbi:hypothetical protein FQN54_005770 [Arachnomyces sp. PD_36]|nr:hypothetical protein FQN54_005770 [Arachnomyces sp. PD_36]